MWDRLLVICTIDSYEPFESGAESPVAIDHLTRLDAVGVAHFLDRQRARLVVAVDDPHPAVREAVLERVDSTAIRSPVLCRLDAGSRESESSFRFSYS